MKKLIFLTLIFNLVLFSCKTRELKDKKVSLKKYSLNAFEKKLIEKDPLILLDGKVIGLLSTIDFNKSEFKIVSPKSLRIVPKGSEYLKRFWGENAQNGIIEISKFSTLYCGKTPKAIYLWNDKEINHKQFEKIKPEDILFFTIIDDLVDSKKKPIELYIVLTKNSTE